MKQICARLFVFLYLLTGCVSNCLGCGLENWQYGRAVAEKRLGVWSVDPELRNTLYISNFLILCVSGVQNLVIMEQKCQGFLHVSVCDAYRGLKECVCVCVFLIN